MTLVEFRLNVLGLISQCPKYWRRGQAAFNILDSMGLARPVQEKGIDCFYDDSKIDEFIEEAWKLTQ